MGHRHEHLLRKLFENWGCADDGERESRTICVVGNMNKSYAGRTVGNLGAGSRFSLAK